MIDANYVLRWFLNDIKEQAALVKRLLLESDDLSLELDRISMAEITYVLRGMTYNNKQISTILKDFGCHASVRQYSPIEQKTLDIYEKTTLDFEDCYLIAKSKVDNTEIGTFDKKLMRVSSGIVN